MTMSLLGRFGAFGLFGPRPRSGGPNTVTLPRYLLTGGQEPTVAEGFEDASQWTGTAGSPTIENNATAGQFLPWGGSTQSVKLISTAASGAVTMRKSGLSLDLSAAGTYLPLHAFNNHTGTISDITVRLYNNFATARNFAWILSAQRASKFNFLWLDKTAPGFSFNSPSFSEPFTDITLSFTSPAIGRAFSFDNLCLPVTPVPAISLQFHDAWPSLMSVVYPAMQERGLRGVVVPYTDAIGMGSNPTYADLLTLQDAGWEIINHTVTHSNMTTLANQAAMEDEISDARAELIAGGALSQPASDYGCYPIGDSGWNATAEAAWISQGYKIVTGALPNTSVREFFPHHRLTILGSYLTAPPTGAQVVTQIQTLAAKGGFLNVVIHDVSATGDLTVAELDSVLDEIVAQEIPVITQDEIWRLQSGSVEVPVPW